MINDTRSNDQLILMMAFRNHDNNCRTGFYDNKEMEINAAGVLCAFALNHDLLHTYISDELLSYIELKGYTKEVEKYENKRV